MSDLPERLKRIDNRGDDVGGVKARTIIMGEGEQSCLFCRSFESGYEKICLDRRAVHFVVGPLDAKTRRLGCDYWQLKKKS